jgi:hypothetical protein
MGGYLGAAALTLLLITGGLAVALALGLAALHWLTGRPRPYLDAGGWAMAAYGCTALGTYDVLTGEAGIFTVAWITGAAVSGYITGRRTCGQWVAIPVHLHNPEEGPT